MNRTTYLQLLFFITTVFFPSAIQGILFSSHRLLNGFVFYGIGKCNMIGKKEKGNKNSK
jgi:hypothetical protein